MSYEPTVFLGKSHRGIDLNVASVTDIGDRALNEDAFEIWRNDRWFCCVVCDGAGGHQAGEVAAQMAVSEFIHHFAQRPSIDQSHLREMTLAVNQSILQAQRQEANRGMHSTFAVLVADLQNQQTSWLHVGDTRIYHSRAGVLLHQSRDHSIKQFMHDQSASQSASDQEKNYSRNELYTALGEPNNRLIMTACNEPIQLRQGDRFLLCTDGFWESLSEQEIISASQSHFYNPNDYLHCLFQLAKSRTRGHADNLTAVAMFFD